MIKKLPYATTKKQLQEMYKHNLTSMIVKDSINEIVKKSREDKGLLFNKNFKTITHNEFQEFIDIWGLPKGYEVVNN
jgi:hypothetical protein